MPGSRYITGTNHSATLAAALNDFHRALTRRWREVVCEAIVRDHYDYPSVIRRPISPHSHQPLWNYRTLPARAHLGLHGGCAYVAWVNAGQNGPLSAVTCDGSTGVSPREEVVLPDLRTREMVTIPPHIECGVGSILQQVEDWAWGERDHVFYRLPMFDNHDVAALERAHDAFVKLGARLGLEADAGSNAEVRGTFTPMTEREIPASVEAVSGAHGRGQHWWAGWTGLAASRAKSGFFASVVPTLNNQSGIAGSLANLYSDRAAIIEKGRNDALYWIQWATESLGETELVTTDRTTGWKAVQGIGTGIAITGGWSGVGAAVGATVVLIGFLGENLDPGGRTEAYKHDLAEVVGHLNDKVSDLHSDIDRHEFEYYGAVRRLQRTLHTVHSYNLELYDLTQNSPDGEGEERSKGYRADIDSILRIAEECYRAGEYYEGLLSIITATAQADSSLADKDGKQTAADMALLEVRDQLEGFLKTSCGRYLVGGDQVKDAAEAYVEVDKDQEDAFLDTMNDWETEEVGNLDVDFDREGYAEETDRSGYDPWEGHPARGGGEPGAGGGTDYVTESGE